MQVYGVFVFKVFSLDVRCINRLVITLPIHPFTYVFFILHSLVHVLLYVVMRSTQSL